MKPVVLKFLIIVALTFPMTPVAQTRTAPFQLDQNELSGVAEANEGHRASRHDKEGRTVPRNPTNSPSHAPTRCLASPFHRPFHILPSRTKTQSKKTPQEHHTHILSFPYTCHSNKPT